MKKKENNMLVYTLIVAAIIVVVFSAYAMLNTNYGTQYQKALSAEQEDICATPPGYTDEAWRQHMSHHPDRYAECL